MNGQYRIPYSDSMYYENNKGWMISHSSLCELDFVKKKARIVKKFDKDFEDGFCPFLGVVCIDKKFYLSPGIEGKCIGIYDCERGEMKKIQLKEIDFEHRVNSMLKPTLNPGIRVGNYIVFSGFSYPAIVVLDTLTDEVFYFDDWITQIDVRNENVEEFTHYFSKGYEIVDNSIILGFACLPMLFKLDFNSMETEIIKIDTEVYGISGISKLDENYFIITGRGMGESRCLLCNRITYKIEKQIKIDEVNSQSPDNFYPVIKCNERYFLFPYITLITEKVYEIDANAFCYKNVKKIATGIKKYLESDTYFAQHALVIVEENGIIRYLSGNDLYWYEWNEKTDSIIKYLIELDEDENLMLDCWADSARDFVNNGTTVPESLIPLEGLLNMIKKPRSTAKKEDEESIGENICKLIVQ